MPSKGIIYCITNLVNDKKYIGKTIQDLEERIKRHFYDALSYKDEERCICIAIRKYGKENFKWEKIWEGDSCLLDDMEKYYINKFNTCVFEDNSYGYNMTLGGDGGWDYHINKRRVGKSQSEIYGIDKSKEISRKRSHSLSKDWKENRENRLKNNHFVIDNPMEYLDFSNEKNPNYGRKHPKLNSKLWLLHDENGNEELIVGLRPYFEGYNGTFRVQTLIQKSKNGNYYKGFWCKEIRDCLSLYDIQIKSRYY